MMRHRAVQKGRDAFIGGDGRGKDKEAQEREQQHIVGLDQNAAVDDKHRRRHDERDARPERGAADNGSDDQREDTEVGDAVRRALRLPFARAGSVSNACPLFGVVSVGEEYKSHKKHRGENPEGEHIRDKPPRGHPGLSVDEKSPVQFLNLYPSFACACA